MVWSLLVPHTDLDVGTYSLSTKHASVEITAELSGDKVAENLYASMKRLGKVPNVFGHSRNNEDFTAPTKSNSGSISVVNTQPVFRSSNTRINGTSINNLDDFTFSWTGSLTNSTTQTQTRPAVSPTKSLEQSNYTGSDHLITTWLQSLKLEQYAKVRGKTDPICNPDRYLSTTT